MEKRDGENWEKYNWEIGELEYITRKIGNTEFEEISLPIAIGIKIPKYYPGGRSSR